MSLYDYRKSREIEADDNYSFYALIMATMRMADTENLLLLQSAWPEVWSELQRRYHAPGGELPEDSR